MTTQTAPPIRVLEAQYIQGTKQIMHRVQLGLGPGRDPVILWMTLEEWRHWCEVPPDRIPALAQLRQELIG